MKSSNLRALRALIVALAISIPSLTAVAQNTGFELDRFVPSSSQRTDYINVESGQAHIPNALEIGIYAYLATQELVLYIDGEDSRTVMERQIMGDLYVAWAPIDRLRLSVDLPLHFSQTGGEEELIGLEPACLDAGRRGGAGGGGTGGGARASTWAMDAPPMSTVASGATASLWPWPEHSPCPWATRICSGVKASASSPR